MPDMAAGVDAVGLRVKMWGCPLPTTCDQDLEKTGLHPGKDYIYNLVFIYNPGKQDSDLDNMTKEMVEH